MIEIPAVPAANIERIWGERGKGWLRDLPELVGSLTAEWGVTIDFPYAMTLHWVAAVTTSDGRPAVLKAGVPDGHLDREAEALRIFDGNGAVRLLRQGAGVLLIERAVPGERAAALVPDDDTAATAALIDTGRRLHRVPGKDCALPHLRQESKDFADYLRRKAGPLPRRSVERAAELLEALCDSADDRVLHGDLHHDNVLRCGGEWKAIDPHGWIGDPGFDCGAMLYNPDPKRDTELLRLVPSRIEQLADGYRMPIERVRAWGFVMGMLSEVWNAEGGAVGTRALDVAELLEPMLD